MAYSELCLEIEGDLTFAEFGMLVAHGADETDILARDAWPFEARAPSPQPVNECMCSQAPA